MRLATSTRLGLRIQGRIIDECDSLAHASALYAAARDRHLAAGRHPHDLPEGKVHDLSDPAMPVIARISWNARVWPPEAWSPGQVPLFDPSAAKGALMHTTIPEQIAALRDMGTKDLQAEHERVIGTPSRSFNTGWLRQRLARALAEQAPEPTSPEIQRAVRVATGPPPKPRPHDPRIPPVGSVIRRQYQGREIVVTVRRTGFKYEGRLYRSLSAIARKVTGARWSGPLFFGLAPRNRGRRTG